MRQRHVALAGPLTFSALAAVVAIAAPAPAAHAQRQKRSGAAPPPPPPASAVLTSAASKQQQPANPAALEAAVPAGAPRVVYGGEALPAADDKKAPYRDPFDGEVCVSPEALAPLGVTYLVDEKGRQVTLMAAESGRSVTVDLRPAPKGGDKAAFLAVGPAIRALGGRSEFDPKTNTLYLRSVLTAVEMLGGQLRVKSSLPVQAKVTSSRDRKLIIVDVPGAEVGDLPKTLDLKSPGVAKARTGQFNPDTARVVLEMEAPSGFFVLGAEKPATLLTLNPLPERGGASSVAKAAPASRPAPQKVAKAPAGKPGKTPAPTFVKGVSFRRVSDSRAQIVIDAGSAPALRPALEGGQLTLSFLNATFADGAGDALSSAEHPFVKAARLVPGGGTTAQLLVELTRTVNFQILNNPNGGIIVDLRMPRGAGGVLAGRTIVVDAGHGAHDAGARGVNGWYEKNVNLGVARKLAEELRDMDVNVVMTRDSDTFLGVHERAYVANRLGADFLISVHSDSARGGANGSTVYYHLNNADCRSLAQTIAARFKAMGGIKTNGPRSDGRIYTNGFGVLRSAQMVAVLVECGFMTNSNDVRFLSSVAGQQKIARAIALGVKDYVEGLPAGADTRFVNPVAVGAGVPSAPAPSLAAMPTTAATEGAEEVEAAPSLGLPVPAVIP